MPGRPLSPLAIRVKSRMDELHITQKDLRKTCAFNHGFISDLLRGAKQDMKDAALDKVAAALRTSAEFLRGYTDDHTPPVRPSTLSVRRPVPRPPVSARIAALLARGVASPGESGSTTHAPAAGWVSTASDEDETTAYWEEPQPPPPPLPVGFVLARLSRTLFSSAPADRKSRTICRAPLRLYAADEDGNIRFTDGLVSRTLPRPPSAYAYPAAYGVKWPDDRLAPRVRAGEILVVAPGLYPRLGHDVLVVKRGAQASSIAMIAGRFVGACREHLTIEPYDQQPKIEVPLVAIVAIHGIVAIIIRS